MLACVSFLQSGSIRQMNLNINDIARPAGGASTHRGRRTRQAIVETGLSLLREAGFVGFSMQGVTHRLGISLGNLTYHFPTRDILLQAMMTELALRNEAEAGALRARLAAQPDLDPGFLIESLLDAALDPEAVATVTELWAMANHYPPAAELLERMQNDTIGALLSGLGLEPYAPAAAALRSQVYVLYTFIQGSTAVFGRRGVHHERYLTTRQLARHLFSPTLRKALDEARAVSGMAEA